MRLLDTEIHLDLLGSREEQLPQTRSTKVYEPIQNTKTPRTSSMRSLRDQVECFEEAPSLHGTERVHKTLFFENPEPFWGR